MVSVARILRDYKDAGSLNELLALWGFVDDSAFLTKAGHVGLVYRVQGSTTRASRTSNGRPWCIGSRRAFGYSTSTVACTSTSSSEASSQLSRHRASSRSLTKRFSAARRI